MGLAHVTLPADTERMGPQDDEIASNARAIILALPMREERPDIPPDILISLPTDTGSCCPAFQFGEDGRVLPIVSIVNRLLDAEGDPWGVASWWASPHARLAGVAPLDLIGGPSELELMRLAE